MIITHRRINIAQAYKIAASRGPSPFWITAEGLQAAGAYGSKQSIHRAIRGMLQYDAASIRATRTGPVYRITPAGMSLLGMVAEKQGSA